MEQELNSYQRFLDGDPEGLCQIIGTYKDGLILYLNGFLNDLPLAEELAEDVFVKLVLKKPRFGGRSAFKTWLYTIARNVAMDHIRQRKRQPVSLEEYHRSDEEKSLEESYMQQEEKIRLHQCIKQLKTEYRQVLWLAYFEGFSYRQIGKVMKKSTHSIETLAYRARLALKQILIKEGFTYEDQQRNDR